MGDDRTKLPSRMPIRPVYVIYIIYLVAKGDPLSQRVIDLLPVVAARADIVSLHYADLARKLHEKNIREWKITEKQMHQFLPLVISPTFSVHAKSAAREVQQSIIRYK